MTSPTAQLLELWTLDQKRIVVSGDRRRKQARFEHAKSATAGAHRIAKDALTEVDRLDALIRQYQGDVQRCDDTIQEMRQKQTEAKTNADYMASINAIESSKLEKSKREASVREVTAKQAALREKASRAEAHAKELDSKLEKLVAELGAIDQPSAEELELDKQYQERRAAVPGEFLEVYERLVAANHKTPLVRVDGRTRSTPYGTLLSMNQIEQIRLGKLVIDRATNAILYIAD